MREGKTDGHIEVITGPMFSGKTEELIRRLRREKIGGGQIVTFKPEKDDRYGEESNLFSHNDRKFKAKLVKSDNRESILKAKEKALEKNPDVIAFDEANFWHEALIDICDDLAHKHGKRVIVAGLDLDFRGEPFSPIPEILSLAEFVSKETARCVECGSPARWTQRLIDGDPAPYDDELIVVGSNERYEARCSDCYERPKKE